MGSKQNLGARLLIVGTVALGSAFIPKDVFASPLELLGQDSHGHQLIYDPNLNLTWYDFRASASGWQAAMGWAADLTVNFHGQVVDDWQLPSAFNSLGGGPCNGGTCIESALKYLYGTELGNTPGGVIHTGPFQSIQTDSFLNAYWLGSIFSGTFSNPLGFAWDFDFRNGRQVVNAMGESDVPYAMAVHQGKVTGTPEPTTILLLATGLVGLGASRKWRKY